MLDRVLNTRLSFKRDILKNVAFVKKIDKDGVTVIENVCGYKK